MSDELDRMTVQTEALKAQMVDLDKLAQGFGNRLVTSFASAVIHGGKLSDVLRGLALSLANSALSQGLRPLGNLLGGLMGQVVGSARGNIVSGGRVTPFADGGIVNSPTLFPMRGATGLMGEAGPEAIMPLARGSDGRLGVKGAGSGVSVTVNISTPDAQSFERSQSQVSALIARAVARGQRNL
jgi:phage-related minor tail protein